jgi:hypothetical protein
MILAVLPPPLKDKNLLRLEEFPSKSFDLWQCIQIPRSKDVIRLFKSLISILRSREYFI